MTRPAEPRRLRTAVGRLPLGVRVLGVLALLLIAVMALALFGPPLPGPNLTAILGLADEPATLCEPDADDVRAPETPPPSRGRWRAEPALPDGRDELRAAYASGSIFIAGGQEMDGEGGVVSIGTMHALHRGRGEYRTAPPLPIPLDHADAVAYRGDLYVVGGYSNDEVSARLWRYSPDDRRWTELAPMGIPRAGHGAAVVGNRMYVVGGGPEGLRDYIDVNPFAALEIYDFRTDSWERGPDMPTARHHLAVTAAGGEVYALGGRAPGEFSLDVVERYDPARDAWEALPPLPLGSGGLAAAAVDGKVVAIGGGDDLEQWVTPATWAFDPRRETWRRLPNLRTPRHGHAAAVVGDRVYAFGGSPCDNFGQLDDAESLAVPPSPPRR